IGESDKAQLSMDEVTKKSFENGLTAVEVGSRYPREEEHYSVSSSVSVTNILFNLLAQWPANQAIIEYMAALLKSQLLPLHMFTSVFLRTTRSSELMDPRSLDLVCQLIISTTQASPLDTIVSVVDPLEPIATTLLDTYNLVRNALGVPYTTMHDLQSSASNILLLALQYSRPFLPQLSSTEILQLLTLGHEIYQQPNIRPELLNLLENVNQLLSSLLSVSNTLPATHGEILAMSMPQPELGPSETSDIVSCSLLIRNSLPLILKRFIENSGVPNSQLEFALPFPVSMETDDLTSIRNPSSFRIEFLNSLVSFGILDSAAAKSIQESWSEKTSPCPLLNELSSQGQTEDSGGDEQKRILELFVTDPCHQSTFAEGLTAKTEELISSFDLIALSTLCETLYTHPSALDVLALYISIPSFLKTFLKLVDSLDWSSI
ncbi:12205_t:CDS:2, partial [Acaulospora colombiana]